MTDIVRHSSADRSYREWGPYVTNGNVDGCEWAFTAVDAAPEEANWDPGEVDHDPDDATRHIFRMLVSGDGGGGTVELAQGQYRMWLRVEIDPELHVFPIGTLDVY